VPSPRTRAGLVLRRVALAFGSVLLGAVAAVCWYLVPSARCPSNARADRLRAFGTLALLAATAEGRVELAALGRRPRLCFAELPEGVLQHDAILILPSKRSCRANAARAGHLISHQLHGAPLDERAARSHAESCQELTRRAMQREASAYALEARVAQALGVSLGSTPPPLLERDYRTRCEALRAEGRRTIPRRGHSVAD
jgi:hypothetical protein